MKLFKTNSGIVIEKESEYFLITGQQWDAFINDDNIVEKVKDLTAKLPARDKSLINEVVAPVGSKQLCACGVTYIPSKVGRKEESKLSGRADFYAKVYEATRHEVFFKATANRIVGHQQKVRIRKDSTSDVPEPELTLVVTSS